MQHPPGAVTGRRPLQEPLYMSNRQSYLPSSVKVRSRGVGSTLRRDRTALSVHVGPLAGRDSARHHVHDIATEAGTHMHQFDKRRD